MPCPPHPIELLEDRCRASERRCASLRRAWDLLLPHAETLLSLVKAPPKGAPSLLKGSLPSGPPEAPTYDRKPKKLPAYGDSLNTWLARAIKIEKAYEDRLCKVRTLVIQLGDELTEWPYGLDQLHEAIKATHLEHRRGDLAQFIKNLRWHQGLWDTTPEDSAEIELQIQRLEAMDDETLVRWNPDEE